MIQGYPTVPQGELVNEYYMRQGPEISFRLPQPSISDVNAKSKALVARDFVLAAVAFGDFFIANTG
jgi:hypothetical protein